jgi:drug/metabolite transporter (DMT)-like permease
MTYEEKNAWVYAALAVALPAGYFWIVLSQLSATPASDIAYQQPLLIAIGAAIGSSIILSILLGIFSPKNTQRDQRDTDIKRRGEYVGGIVLGVAMVIPFLLALTGTEHFWIANTIYLAFVLSAFCGTAVKLVAYRRGF